MENLEHAESGLGQSYAHVDDPFSRSEVGEFDEPDSAVIELADNHSIENFLSANHVQDHGHDDTMSLFSGVSQVACCTLLAITN